MRRIKLFFLFAIPLVLAGCSLASVASRFSPEISIKSEPKPNISHVEYLTKKPSRSALRIGVISTNGNGFSGFDDLIEKAKKEAASLGADFIMAENSGVESKTFFSPGYSTYNENASASYGTSYGYGSGSAKGYSVGPSINTFEYPWCNFTVWIFSPSQIGIHIDGNNIISGFHLNSDAPDIGVKVGDQLIGIDDYDVLDEQLIKHLMKVYPGDKVKLILLRDAKKVEKIITALPNL
jgi:hypothetical protein